MSKLTDYPINPCQEDDIAFTKVKLPFGWMQNMAAFSVTYKDHLFPTTEHLFQAMRFPFESEHFLHLKTIKSPMSAKFYAKGNAEHMTVLQTGTEDLDNMELCLMLKVQQHEELMNMLAETGERRLIEDVTSRPHGSGKFWGAAREGDNWVGYNVLGELWMKIRSS
jgi:N-glycosidase YbiA